MDEDGISKFHRISRFQPDFERLGFVRNAHNATKAELVRIAKLDPAKDFRFADLRDADWRHTDRETYDLEGAVSSSIPDGIFESNQELFGSKLSESTDDKTLPFRPGDFVVYPAHGVGKIVSVELQEIAGMTLELYVISLAATKMVLRVPTAKAGSIGLRRISSKEKITEALSILKDEKGAAKPRLTLKRGEKVKFDQRINSGDLNSIAEIVRDLYPRDDRPSQSYIASEVYEAALRRLLDEFAAVFYVDEATVKKEVDALLSGRSAA
jgi:CarD family transcriptional regulator